MGKPLQSTHSNELRSKKRVKWIISHHNQIHEIYCIVSFKSGKKKVIHNGHIIMDIVDPK